MEKVMVLPPLRLFYSVLWYVSRERNIPLGVLMVKPWGEEGMVRFSKRALARIANAAERRAARAWILACERYIPMTAGELQRLFETTQEGCLLLTEPMETAGSLERMNAKVYQAIVGWRYKRGNLYRVIIPPILTEDDERETDPVS